MSESSAQSQDEKCDAVLQDPPPMQRARDSAVRTSPREASSPPRAVGQKVVAPPMSGERPIPPRKRGGAKKPCELKGALSLGRETHHRAAPFRFSDIMIIAVDHVFTQGLETK